MSDDAGLSGLWQPRHMCCSLQSGPGCDKHHSSARRVCGLVRCPQLQYVAPLAELATHADDRRLFGIVQELRVGRRTRCHGRVWTQRYVSAGPGARRRLLMSLRPSWRERATGRRAAPLQRNSSGWAQRLARKHRPSRSQTSPSRDSDHRNAAARSVEMPKSKCGPPTTSRSAAQSQFSALSAASERSKRTETPPASGQFRGAEVVCLPLPRVGIVRRARETSSVQSVPSTRRPPAVDARAICRPRARSRTRARPSRDASCPVRLSCAVRRARRRHGRTDAARAGALGRAAGLDEPAHAQGTRSEASRQR